MTKQAGWLPDKSDDWPFYLRVPHVAFLLSRSELTIRKRMSRGDFGPVIRDGTLMVRKADFLEVMRQKEDVA